MCKTLSQVVCSLSLTSRPSTYAIFGASPKKFRSESSKSGLGLFNYKLSRTRRGCAWRRFRRRVFQRNQPRTRRGYAWRRFRRRFFQQLEFVFSLVPDSSPNILEPSSKQCSTLDFIKTYQEHREAKSILRIKRINQVIKIKPEKTTQLITK